MDGRENLRKHLREQENGKGKDNGNDPGLIYSKRQVRRDAAVEAHAADSLGVGDRNLPLAFGNDHHSPNHQNGGGQKSQVGRDLARVVGGDELTSALGKTGDNPGKNNERNPVPDPLLGNQLAKPHEKHRAGGDDNDVRQKPKAAKRLENLLILEQGQEPKRLEGCQGNSQIPRVLVEFRPARLTLLVVEFFYFRKDHCQKLHDDGGGNVRPHPEHQD